MFAGLGFQAGIRPVTGLRGIVRRSFKTFRKSADNAVMALF